MADDIVTAGGKVSDKQDIVDRLHNILLHEKDGLALTWLATCAANEIERLRAELVKNADEFRETSTKLRQRVETLTAEREMIAHFTTVLIQSESARGIKPPVSFDGINALVRHAAMIAEAIEKESHDARRTR